MWMWENMTREKSCGSHQKKRFIDNGTAGCGTKSGSVCGTGQCSIIQKHRHPYTHKTGGQTGGAGRGYHGRNIKWLIEYRVSCSSSHFWFMELFWSKQKKIINENWIYFVKSKKKTSIRVTTISFLEFQGENNQGVEAVSPLKIAIIVSLWNGSIQMFHSRRSRHSLCW